MGDTDHGNNYTKKIQEKQLELRRSIRYWLDQMESGSKKDRGKRVRTRQRLLRAKRRRQGMVKTRERERGWNSSLTEARRTDERSGGGSARNGDGGGEFGDAAGVGDMQPWESHRTLAIWILSEEESNGAFWSHWIRVDRSAIGIMTWTSLIYCYYQNYFIRINLIWKMRIIISSWNLLYAAWTDLMPNTRKPSSTNQRL